MSDSASFLEVAKEGLGKRASMLIAGAFFVANLLVSITANHTRFADDLAQQDKRISTLEESVKNDLVTRREVDDVKSTVVRIEDKLDKYRDEENRHHHGK